MRTNGTRQYLQNDFAHNITQVGLGHINQSNIGVSVTHKLIILKKKGTRNYVFNQIEVKIPNADCTNIN